MNSPNLVAPKKNKKAWFGATQRKILLLLLGGIALSCVRSPKKQWKLVKEMRREWEEISKQAAERAINGLYESKLLESRENADGSMTLTLNEDGKKRALTYRIRYTKVRPKGPWDGKWRIVIYDIPEDKRKDRDAFRAHLTDIGMRKLQNSASITPFECKNEVEFFVELLDIRKYVRFIVADSIDDELFWKRKFALQAN